MDKSWFRFKHLVVVAGLALAFIGGRFSAPSGENTDGDEEANHPRSTSRVKHRKLARISKPGAGAGALQSTEQLRELFSKDYKQVLPTLGKMNARELALLAADLADAHVSQRGVPNWYEITHTFTKWAELDPEAALRFAKQAETPFHLRAIESVLKVIIEQDPGRALSEAKNIKNRQISNQLKANLLNTMALKTPDAWITEILSDTDSTRLAGNNVHLIAHWFKDDPEAALARINRLPEDLVARATPSIVGMWATKDSAAALEWVNTLEHQNQRNRAIAAIANVIAKERPDDALEIINEIPGTARITALKSIYQRIPKSDPMAVFEQVMALDNHADRYAALEGFLRTSGHDSWGSSYHHYGQQTAFTLEQLQTIAARLPQGSMRNTALSKMSFHLRSMTTEESNQVLSQYPEHERRSMVTSMIQTLYSADPEHALALHQQHFKEGHSHSYYSSILSTLAMTQPQKSLKLAIEADSNKENSSSHTISSVISSLPIQYLPKAASEITKIEDEKTRNDAINRISSHWGRNDPEAAQAWAQGLDENTRFRALISIIPGMASNNPQDAARQLESLASELAGDRKRIRNLSSAASSIASSWSKIDPESAATWVSNLQNESAQTHAVGQVASNWSRRDIDSTAEWLNSLSNTKARDAGIRSVISNLSGRNQASAFEWAMSITNESHRMSSLSNIVSNWKRQNKQRAIDAVKNANLSEKEYERLMRDLK